MSKSTPTTPESWETLLEAVKDTALDLPGVAPFRNTLAAARTRALALKAVRTTLEASAKDARQSHREALTAGKDAAVALRGFVRSTLGHRNEKLLTYGMIPLGRVCRGRRKLAVAARSVRGKGGGKK
jgi:hypothetical protein